MKNQMYVDYRNDIPVGYRYGEEWVAMQLAMEGGYPTEEEAYRAWLRDEGIEVIPDKKDGGYVFRDTHRAGCVTQAESIAEGVVMIQDARRAWEEARGL